MSDLKKPRGQYLQGILFLGGGIFSGGLLLWEIMSFKVAFLLLICVGCFLRFFYLTWKSARRKMDAAVESAGVWSFVKFLLGRDGK